MKDELAGKNAKTETESNPLDEEMDELEEDDSSLTL